MDGVGVPGVAAREYAIEGVGVAPLSDAPKDAPVWGRSAMDGVGENAPPPGTSSLHRTPGVPGVRPGV